MVQSPGETQPVVGQQFARQPVAADRGAKRRPGQLPGQRPADASVQAKPGVVIEQVDHPIRAAVGQMARWVPSICHNSLLASRTNWVPGQRAGARRRRAVNTPRRANASWTVDTAGTTRSSVRSASPILRGPPPCSLRNRRIRFVHLSRQLTRRGLRPPRPRHQPVQTRLGIPATPGIKRVRANPVPGTHLPHRTTRPAKLLQHGQTLLYNVHHLQRHAAP